MGRLIDADKLKDFLFDLESNASSDKTKSVINDMLHEAFIKFIDEQQTAYDVDKVVNILQQQAEQYRGRAEKYAVAGVNNEVEHMAGKAASYEYAIDIVKAGGVDAN